jgi:hypothetical protein
MARRSAQHSKPTRDRAAADLSQSDDRIEPPIARLSVRLRLLASAAITFHLAAVFIGAWIGSPPTSPFADQVARPFRAYIAAADLNHGYRFFAPNPGPSHLFRYQLTFDDGSTRDGYFPNRAEHWPRLLYHRYFMLSENLNVLRPRAPTPEAQAAIEKESLRPFRALAQSYAGQLLRASGAAQIDWQLVRHYQPAPADVLAGQPLNDDDFYEPLERGSLEREELP